METCATIFSVLSFFMLKIGFIKSLTIEIEVIFNSESAVDIVAEIRQIITKKISSSFVDSSQNKRKQSHIFITYSYSHNYNNDTVVNNIPNERKCLYNIKGKTIIPTYKSLIIPKFGYFDFFEQ